MSESRISSWGPVGRSMPFCPSREPRCASLFQGRYSRWVASRQLRWRGSEWAEADSRLLSISIYFIPSLALQGATQIEIGSSEDRGAFTSPNQRQQRHLGSDQSGGEGVTWSICVQKEFEACGVCRAVTLFDCRQTKGDALTALGCYSIHTKAWRPLKLRRQKHRKVPKRGAPR